MGVWSLSQTVPMELWFWSHLSFYFHVNTRADMPAWWLMTEDEVMENKTLLFLTFTFLLLTIWPPLNVREWFLTIDKMLVSHESNTRMNNFSADKRSMYIVHALRGGCTLRPRWSLEHSEFSKYKCESLPNTLRILCTCSLYLPSGCCNTCSTYLDKLSR